MKTTISYWRMPEAVWRRIRKLVPKWHPSPKGGRPALETRRVADGIYYVIRTGCPWKAVPREFGSGSCLHSYFQKWVACGVFRKLWRQGLIEYDQKHHIAWRWQALDTAMNKAPLGGGNNREKPYRPRKTCRQALRAH